ncbi:MAG: diaminopimelate epimerase [Verrucomicrobia bacterium]|nr:diaminopimelate epimerase [Verrucomicrobiota bacterium]
MATEIPFWKMHGAANDFIMVDDRALTFPLADREWIAGICARRTGVGSEGLILIQPSDSADFRMRFFNPDGGEVEMCGNGARCVARLANDIGAAPADMRFDTIAGLVGASVLSEDTVRLVMTRPKDWKLNQAIEINGETMTWNFVNSGVPHVVIEVDDVDNVDVHTLGSAIRHHNLFAPAGTNVNFVQIRGNDSLRIRTYERGVEAETCACGTGMVAAGLIAGKLGRVSVPVQVVPASGDILQVGFDITDDGAENVTLTGPAVYVFRGSLTYP